MPGVSYAFASILGTFLESVMYGIFVTLFIAACCVQWEKFSERGNLNRLMALSTVFFGITVTANFGISLFQMMQLISHPPRPEIGLVPSISTSGIVWLVTLQFQTLVADVIIVYRMYYIHDKNILVCIPPAITILATFTAGCGVVGQLRSPSPDPKALGIWSTVSFCVGIFNGFLLTTMISFRLWRVHRQTMETGVHVEGSIVLRAMKVLIESAALWTAFTVMNFFAYIAKSSLSFTFLAMSGPAVGISFCLIIVRLGRVLPEARDETWYTSSRTPTSRTRIPDRVAVSFPQVKIQRDVHVRSESEEFPMEALESQKRGYIRVSDDLSKGVWSSHPTPTAL